MGRVGYLPKSTSLGELSQRSHACERIGLGAAGFRRGRRAGAVRDGADAARADSEADPAAIRVLHLIIRGLQNREIASELKLAESTVKAHVTEILRKLKLFSRNKAIIELGKIPLPRP